ncbi:archaemetzincin [Leptolyngbya sp. 7M]|uniref:archaemetzincin n=1 Tax=Leptolyngbya sp. 7M TaxID=2812896 RepID=UPI001B8B14CC|nr:archaemetzincin [Leptolyngbya sp. 7M]QYO63364.1 archaemetzincin [Leptolyngbya sp. 7M]
MLKAISAAVVLTVIITGCTAVEPPKNTAADTGQEEKLESLRKQRDAVVKFFEPMRVRPGDWLDTQREQGETFEEYISANPTLPIDDRWTIYIQPIGRFNSEQLAVIDKVAEYMRAFYSLPVRLNSAKPLGEVPFDKKRLIKYRNNLQINTSYFLDDLLPKLLPNDAAALIAFTNYDLYPEPTRAFVFGQASLTKRTGVWSFYQFADPKTGRYDPKLMLERSLKIAMHETGHMFSMKHCTKYECLMSGTNHLAETDRRPLDNCPECMAASRHMVSRSSMVASRS